MPCGRKLANEPLSDHRQHLQQSAGMWDKEGRS